MRVTLVVKKPCTYKGDVYAPGNTIVNVDRDSAVIALERKGAVEAHNPQWDGGYADDSASRRVMYTGEKQTLNHSTGFFYRCVDRLLSDFAADNALSTIGVDFTEIDMPGVYIPHNTTISYFDVVIAPHINTDAPKILFMRDEGIGDVLMSIPTVREVKRRYPDSHIVYATLPKHFELIDECGCIDEVISVHGMDVSRNSGYDLVVNWCHSVENYNTPRNRNHRVDSFAAHIGLKLTDRSLEYNVKPDDISFAVDAVGGSGRPLIGYVVKSASWMRTYPIWRIPDIAELVCRRFGSDARLILIDNSAVMGDMFGECSNVINLCGRTATVGQAAAVMSLCDAVITPDTGTAHICGALGIKQVVIMGEIPQSARYDNETHPGTVVVKSRVWCAPCWSWQIKMTGAEIKKHPGIGSNRNCEYTRDNICMMNIRPLEIVNALAGVLA